MWDSINTSTLGGLVVQEKVEKGFLYDRIIKLDNNMEILDIDNSINFAVVTRDNYLILAKQYRPTIGRSDINLFGGYIDKEESAFGAIIRELKEETNIDECDIHCKHIVAYEKYVSLGYTKEKNTICIISTKNNLKDLNLKCNDKKENIEFYIEKICSRTLYELQKECLGLKTLMVLQTLMNLYK